MESGMEVKFLLGIAVAIAVIFFAAAFAQSLQKSALAKERRETLYQVSTIDALMQGVYDGVQPFGELKKHGDFGIGTFDALDGEMVAVDTRYYQVRSDGIAYPVDDAMTTPFATVTYFEPDIQFSTDRQMNYSLLFTYLSGRLPSKNLIYAIRADGTFPAMKVRSVPRQSPPYLPLPAAVANQSVFEYTGAAGTVVGFYMPEFTKGINVPFYHLHFISADKKTGGHILDFTIATNTTITLDITPEFEMSLPTKGAFAGTDLSKDTSADLAKVER
jgi:acetolactate decarboxylase